MSSSLLSPLIGHTVVAVEVVYDYLHLRFDNGDVLNIYNNFEIQGVGSSDVTALVGQPLSAVSDRPEAVRLQLGELVICVSLLDEAFNGPEAIQYKPKSGPSVVWS